MDPTMFRRARRLKKQLDGFGDLFDMITKGAETVANIATKVAVGVSQANANAQAGNAAASQWSQPTQPYYQPPPPQPAADSSSKMLLFGGVGLVAALGLFMVLKK